jgi:integrase
MKNSFFFMVQCIYVWVHHVKIGLSCKRAKNNNMIVPLSVTSKTGKKVAVLTPMIWEHLSPTYKMRGDLLLYTGMRIVEAFQFAKHPDYFRKENEAIFLPIVPGIGKARCTILQRTILLPERGIVAVEEFFKHKVGFAAYQNMEAAFVLAAAKADFDTSFITTKMFRKTMVSWLMTVYPDRQSQISRCAGHDIKTMNKHYLADGWRKEDKKDMVEELKGWGGI